MSNLQRIAEFVHGLRYSDIPKSVVEQAKIVIRNSIAAQLAGSTLPWSKQVYRYGRMQGGHSEATIVNYGLRTSAANAAFVNSAFANGLEMDDNHALTGIKGGCVTVPTALALAERQGSSGRDVIASVVAGYEVLIRAGLMIRASATKRAMHPTGTSGALGASATASRLLGLGREATVHALGAAAANMGGFSEAPASGRGHLKRIFGAMAAQGGIRAAQVSQCGITGPTTSLDPGSGFLRAFDVDSDAPNEILSGLGRTWEILNCHIKPYAQDGYIQPVSEALDILRSTYDFEINDILEVRLGLNHRAANEIVGLVREPTNLGDAQFSANYCAALFLVRGGSSFDDFTEENLWDPEVRELSKRVQTYVDDEVDAEYRKTRPRGAKVSIALRDGRVLHEFVRNLRDMTVDEVDRKFVELTSRVFPSRAEELLAYTHDLQDLPDVYSLIASMSDQRKVRRSAEA